MPSVKRIAFSVLGVWLLLCGLMYIFQRRLQYFPDSGPVPTPRRTGLEDITLTTSDDLKIKAWYWPGKRDTATLLIFHGNAGHRGHRFDWVQGFHARGWGIFLLDYRGYGGSEGSPSEEGFGKDADAAADFLAARGVKKVVYYGRSIGAGVALPLAARRPPAALIIEAGAAAFVEVAKKAYPFMPVGWLMKDRFDSRPLLDRITCPGLFIHGSDDRIVPTALGKELYEAYPAAKELYTVEGAGHNDTSWVDGNGYYERIDAWLKETTGP